MTALRERLLEVFEIEYREHLEAMRGVLARLEGAPHPADLNEVTRRAHTLKGAARAVGLTDVEELAHGLESLFVEAKAGEIAFDADRRGEIADALNEIEDRVASSRAPANDAIAYAGDDLPISEMPVARPISVRVGAIHIDELFTSAGELQSDLVRHYDLAENARAMAADAAALEGFWSLRKQGHAGERDELGALILGLRTRAQQSAAAHAASAAMLRGHVQRLSARVRAAGMLSADDVFGGFRKMVRDLALEQGKDVAVHLEGLDCEADRLVLQRLKDPVMHLLRNAVGHGIEAPDERRAKGKAPEGRVRLAVSSERGRLSVVVEDDGCGVDFAAVGARAVECGMLAPAAAVSADREALARLLFEPGFSTASEVTRISGRGVGLSAAREAVGELDGTIAIVAPGTGTRIEISVPLSILARRLCLVSFRGQDFGIPADAVVKVLRVPLAEFTSIEGRPALQYGGAPIPLRSLGALLDLPDADVATESSRSLIVVVQRPAGRMGLAVEGFGVVGDFAVRPLAVATGSHRFWSGITLTPSGAPCLVLGAGALAHLGTPAGAPLVFSQTERIADEQPRILVVDDSVTTRTLEKNILEAEGYQVRLSVDGADALAQLRAEPVDVVVSDIEMPRVDGFELLRLMRADDKLAEIPVILVTSRADPADRERGLRLGADAYVVKQKFDQVELVKTIRQVI